MVCILAVSAMVAIFPLQQAHAGLFSLLGSFFGNGNETIAEDESQLQETLLTSLHTMPLLNAPVNVDGAKAARGGAALTIVDDNALLPAAGPLGSVADDESVIKTDRITLYTIREGDNISVIARMFGVTVNTILWANNIRSSNLIKPGDVLVILPISGVKHVVKKGDTLASIAKEYHGDVEEISTFNGLLADASLTIGEEVIIPNGEVSVPAPSRSTGTRSIISGGSLQSIVGYFLKPVVGVRSQGLHGYNGVDLAASCGSPIYASAAGTVIVSKGNGWNGGYGNYIVVTHANGTQTLYAHNTSNVVSAGQYVAQGQTIGTVGSTGRSTGCHVHFEVRGAKNPF
ncbi:MAG: peptidase M23 family protein [Parcubacteria group bacterium Gr01-1014_70]|nr:MAG: peptidase M23 family protein [Parcubacteria group bacterium Gr01-1014_70]